MPSSRKRPLPISRQRDDSGFSYREGGRRIRRRAEIKRIEALAIPPAWTNVEIADSPKAKVLARGLDAAGRTQRIYHPAFRRRQERRKFARLPEFAAALPGLRRQVERDLSQSGAGREKLTACAVALIDAHLLRVGNARSARRRKSYGVTTLRKEHVRTTERGVSLDFVGKSGQLQRRLVTNPILTALLHELADRKGNELFRFVDADGSSHRLRGTDVNRYVRRYLGDGYSAKDFRTWGATVVAADSLVAGAQDLESPRAKAAATRAATTAASERLGNTPAIARSSYVDPRVLGAVDHPGTLEEVRRAKARMRRRRHFSVEEQVTLMLLDEAQRPR